MTALQIVISPFSMTPLRVRFLFFVFCMSAVGCMTLTPSVMSSDGLFQQRYCRLLESDILSYYEILVGGLAVLHVTGDVGTSNMTRLRR